MLSNISVKKTEIKYKIKENLRKSKIVIF
jgi:hypothetical protein